MALIEAKNVTKKYKVGSEIITALDDVTLTIEQGEFLAILGTSGCGKSTLLNMLSGLERPTKGDIVINGVRINKVNEKNMSKFRSKEMGFIFQQYNLIGSLTALENVIRNDPAGYQSIHQACQCVCIIVDTLQQYSLITDNATHVP